MQSLQQSPVPVVPDPATSAQEWQSVQGLSAVLVELSWNYRPLHHVCVEASEELADSHHPSYHWTRSSPVVPQAPPPQ